MFAVSVLNEPVSKPMPLADALRTASQAVYASRSTLVYAEGELLSGREVTWAYGFKDVSIMPVKVQSGRGPA